MKNLRGRPPRNISESGIVYLDSDGEDTDYSDSDVEPVFFPAAEFDFDGDPTIEFDIVDALDDTDSDSDDDHPPPYSFPDTMPLPYPSQRNNGNNATNPGGVELGHSPARNNSGNGNDDQEVVWQYFGGTVQVRHIVHENFTQLQQQQQNLNQQRGSSESGDSSNLPLPGTSRSSTEVTGESEEIKKVEDNPDSPGEPPAICESIITIASPSAASSFDMAENEKIQEPEREPNVSVIDREGPSSGLKKRSSLVPYPDLPDYASGGEEDLEEKDGDQGQDNKRQSLKRKDLDEDEDSDMEENVASISKSAKTLRDEVDNDNEIEETCNPMASSDTEEYDDATDALRGDRIGNTVYSERHVLKILMKWVENLPNHSYERLMQAKESEEAEEVIEKTILRLETEFEEQMSLLWDMSAETDVMNFLVENKIFAFIRDTVDRSACGRLTEIALGILANVISEPSVIDDFTVHDASLNLVERVVELTSKVSDVAVLVQVFSVLRRIVWYIQKVAHVKKWIDLLTSKGFLDSANFIMRSSTNALLLGNVIVLFFALIDCLNTENDSEDDELTPVEPSKEPEIDKRMETLIKNYEPFCDSQFVPSLCEGLKELMKDPKPKNTRKSLNSTHEKPILESASGSQTDDHCPNADEVDVPIPEGHVQQSILKGISTLALLQKAPNGKDTLKLNASQVISVLLNFFRIFLLCTDSVTRSDSLEYFTLSLHILSFCHVNLDTVNLEAINGPVTTASKLVIQEEKDKEADMAIRVQLKDGVEFDSVSYIALVTHEYLAAIAEKFGPESALKVRSNSAYSKIFRVIDEVVSKFTESSSAEKN